MKIRKYAERIPQYTARAVLPLVKLPKPPVLSGVGMVRRFPEVIAMTDARRLLIVCDEAAAAQTLMADLQSDLADQDIESVLYVQEADAPELHDVYSAVDRYLSELCDGVLGVGGESALNCAKLIAARVTNVKPVPKMAGIGRVFHRLPPLFAVPTTFGSGCESSIAAEVFDEETGRRLAVVDPKLCPLAVCLDPDLLSALDAEQTAAMGMEVLSVAVEAYIGLFDADDVRSEALDASRLVFDNLEKRAADLSDWRALQNLQRASVLAGEAFSRGMAGYTYAIANVLSEAYNLPKASLKAAVLPAVLAFSADACAGKLAELAYNAGLGTEWDEDEELAEALIERIRRMNASLGLPTAFAAIRPGDVRDLAARVIGEMSPAYPVPKLLEKADVEDVISGLIDLDV